MVRRSTSVVLLICVLPVLQSSLPTTAAMAADGGAFYVSPSGADTNPGTEAAPFATLVRARDAIRDWRKSGDPGTGLITVVIRNGIYRFHDTLTLATQDSGTEQAPVVWRAAHGEHVRLVGGVRLNNWRPVSDPALRQRLVPSARELLLQADLQTAGITDFGDVKAINAVVILHERNDERHEIDVPMDW